MGRTRQEDVRIEHRRTQVAELRTKGWTQAAIAGELGVSPATISSDMKANRQESSESQIGDLDEAIEEQIKMLEVVEREAGDAWERSQQPVETIRITQKNGEKKVEKTVRQRPGDPRFLQIRQRASNTRCKLQGLDAAVPDEQDQESLARQVNGRFWAVFDVIRSGNHPGPDMIDDAYIKQLVISLGDPNQRHR